MRWRRRATGRRSHHGHRYSSRERRCVVWTSALLDCGDLDREDARAAKSCLSFENGVCQITSVTSQFCRVTFREVTVLADLIRSLIEEIAAQRHNISTRVDV